MLRCNLDPFGLHDDARLSDALKRSYLAEDTKRIRYAANDEESGIASDEDQCGRGSNRSALRFTLDSPIEAGGSVGQRSLVSLARALVKDRKIMILDGLLLLLTTRRIEVSWPHCPMHHP
jgi:ABC-type multidrug transport system fused ATPase/permease subunit